MQRGVIIGINVILLPKIKAGAGALVGVGSVVIKDVSDGVVYGNLARNKGK